MTLAITRSVASVQGKGNDRSPCTTKLPVEEEFLSAICHAHIQHANLKATVEVKVVHNELTVIQWHSFVGLLITANHSQVVVQDIKDLSWNQAASYQEPERLKYRLKGDN